MNHWAFVFAAYGVTVGGVVALLLASWRSMRQAEAAAERLRSER